MKYLIDTSAYSHFGRGDKRLAAYFNTKHDLLVPLIMVAELRAGFAAGSHQKFNENQLREFLDKPNVNTCSLTDTTTHHFANIYAGLRKIGRPVGQNDMWIAALGLEHNIPLVTTDGDFAAIAGLKLAKLK